MLSKVVLPEPVPPEMTMLHLTLTSADRSSAMAGVRAFFLSRSLICRGTTAKRRMVSTGPSSASGGMMAFTREPSGRRASAIGVDSSMRRPTRETILSMIFIRCASSLKRVSVLTMRPPRSTKMCSWPLTMISEIALSAINGSSGPRPMISFCRSATSRCFSVALSGRASSWISVHSTVLSWACSCSGLRLSMDDRSMRVSSRWCSCFLKL